MLDTDPDGQVLRGRLGKRHSDIPGISFAFPWPVTLLRYSYAPRIREAKGNTVLWLAWQTETTAPGGYTARQSTLTKRRPPICADMGG